MTPQITAEYDTPFDVDDFNAPQVELKASFKFGDHERALAEIEKALASVRKQIAEVSGGDGGR